MRERRDASPALYFDTDPAWLETIRTWALRTVDVDRVWVFGSRATGVRRPKAAPSAVPDLDVAYTLRGSDPGSLFGLACAEGSCWQAMLQRRIPIPVQLEFADPEDKYVWPAVQAHGVLIYSALD